ncbi:MAG: hypothetical protein HZB55_20565 [Deltaproteobacteria bacterium]|nr:hypothetical protein [Deltaproteobacteria bacterium]
MSEGIHFETTEFASTFLDPRREFEPTVERIQVRLDPLTGRSVHLAHFGAIQPQRLDLESYGRAEVKGFCPFCPEHRHRATPRFPADVLPEGRLVAGETLLVPNLFPYDAFSAVAIMTHEHVVPLEGFTGGILEDAFSTGLKFLRVVRSLPGAPAHALMAWNYMPPSGGGLIHPHQQYFVTGHPGNRYTEELRACLMFDQRHGKDYWSELLREEARRGERYVAEVGGSHWLASFAPIGVLGDLVCVFPGVFGLGDFTGKHVASLVEGLNCLFRYFSDAGIHSFNASLFFGQEGRKTFSAQFRIAPRTFLNTRDYASDLNFFQAVLHQPVSVVRPEDLAREVRPYFDVGRRGE